jgi:hypothetical protein
MSVGCYQDWSETTILVAANRHNTHVIYQLLFIAPPEDEQAMLETCRCC